MSISTKKYLICDSWGATSMNLVETKKSRRDGRVSFFGPFTETDRPNRNNRIYPDKVMRSEFDRLAILAEQGRLLGEADHPSDSVIHIQDVSHRITRMWWDNHHNKVGWCECVTTTTPNGLTLEGLLCDGVNVGISSRGVGSGSMNRDGKLVISEGFRLITGDVVGDPSYQEAWMTMKESIQDNIAKGKTSVSMNGLDLRSAMGAHPVVTKTIEEAIEEGELGRGEDQRAPEDQVREGRISLGDAMMLVGYEAAVRIKKKDAARQP
jgi:hypothetical protein